jgi:hypothetical protein
MLCKDCYFLLMNERHHYKEHGGLDNDKIDEKIPKHIVCQAKVAAKGSWHYENQKLNNLAAYVQSSFQPTFHFLKLQCGRT